MKLYIYYKIGSPTEPFEKPFPYAHTTNKKLMKAFEEYREMKYFYKDTKYVTENDLKSYEFQRRRDNELTFGRFQTQNPDPNAAQKTMCVTIPCTQYEEITVFRKMDEVFFELGKTGSKCTQIVENLKDKYRIGVLTHDTYDYVMNFYNRRFIYESDSYGGTTPTEQLFAGYDDLGYIDEGRGKAMQVDQLGLFLYLFGETVKEGEHTPI